MNGRVPETDDIQKLARSLREVLLWIKEHDNRQLTRLRPQRHIGGER